MNPVSASPLDAAASRPGTAQDAARSRFLVRHLWLPLAAAALCSAWLMGAGADQQLADLLYRLQGGHWLLRDSWATQVLVHRDGRLLSTGAALATLLLAGVPWRAARWRRLRRPAAYLALSVALSTGTVSLLKKWTRVDCPWDLARYGGDRALFGLFQSRHGIEASGCFPAGHASAGYAWVALYFVALAWRPAWRWPALAIGLGAGLVFGFSQQLRGAHFLSHDLWSLATCWSVALGLYLPMLRPGATIARPAHEAGA
ncbi:MAG TPA: hypothetical protein DDZ67_14180 [Xanthomonadaceae bacterium]|nr:hypothetical protein [Xanthomonadaceae bacterium]